MLHHLLRKVSRVHRSMPKSIGACLLVLCTTALIAGPATAQDVWSVRSGEVFFNFNRSLLSDLGLELDVQGARISENDGVFIEPPLWAFPIRAGSDLQFKTEYGVPVPGGSSGGTLRLDGVMTIRDRKSGKEMRIGDLEMGRITGRRWNPEDGKETAPFYLRSSGSKLVWLELIDSMFDFRKDTHELRVHYLNARISPAWARAIGRPELAGWVIGMGEIRGPSTLISSAPPARAPYHPVFEGGIRDVSLSALSSIQYIGRVGTFPTGTNALTMSTTSCNVGEVDVPWLAPMQQDHPLIHMALYRLLNGRFEQVGISWMKHGFFALSNPGCTGPCQHPSDGSFLGVSCNDTYGPSNNQDRNYLGPREEVNPYTNTWTCTGSHFAGGVADCVRRHGSSGHGVLDHRLIAYDGDLNNPGATYYYEGYYLVRADDNLFNNWASRICTMSWNGSVWTFTTPGTSNPLVPGQTINRWGDLRTTIDVAPGDGQVILAVQTTDLGGGVFHYEYALLNTTSDRQIRSFSIPVAGVANITNIGFHDNDQDAGNDWKVSVADGVITWETDSYATNPSAPALEFGYMVNFRFDADAAPTDLNATLGVFKPGTGTEAIGATRGPTNTVTAVGEPNVGRMPRLTAIRPNPFYRNTTIAYELPMAAPVKLQIFDAAGRLVRSLVDESGTPGAHTAVWDGNGENGSRVRPGVYHARLQAGSITAARSVVVVN